jgi:hypothetical protein
MDHVYDFILDCNSYPGFWTVQCAFFLRKYDEWEMLAGGHSSVHRHPFIIKNMFFIKKRLTGGTNECPLCSKPHDEFMGFSSFFGLLGFGLVWESQEHNRIV